MRSLRRITDAIGAQGAQKKDRHFGEFIGFRENDTTVLDETKGFIGERYDENAGLQYLNARYYDPKLGMFLQPDWFEVQTPGVGTNRYSYSFNDPVNRMDPNGNKSKFAELVDAVGAWLKGDSKSKSDINSVSAARDRGVNDAWKMESQLVRKTGQGTIDWDEDELDLLRAGKKVPGYVGHHLTSVNADITKAADHRNVEFMRETAHKDAHPGGFKNPVKSDRVIDRTLGGKLPDLATSGAKSWPERAGRALTAVADSRTVRLLDIVDPTVWADEAYRTMYGGGTWSFSDILMMTPAQRACLGKRCS